MDVDTHKLFDKVARKMGWMDMGGLDVAVENLRGTIGKSRHPGTSDGKHSSSGGDDDGADKENLPCQRKDYRVKASNDSSDDDFDQFLKTLSTPKSKTPSKTPLSMSSKKSSVVVLSSDSDGTFETFLTRVKTPNIKSRTDAKSESKDSFKEFLVNDSCSDDDFIDAKSVRAVPKKPLTPSVPLLRRPLSQCDSPVFVSDSDDDDEENIVIKSTWKTRQKKNKPSSIKTKGRTLDDEEDDDDSSLFMTAKPSPSSVLSSRMTLLTAEVPQRTFSAPSRLDEPSSSEEEFTSLLDRLKKKNKLPFSTPSPAPSKEVKKPVVPHTPINGWKASKLNVINDTPSNFITPSKKITVKATLSQTEPRCGPSSRTQLCKTPGCFLETLSNPGTTYGRNFKINKEELTSRLFKLYNASVFDGKLPATMSVTWNKKMRKTAGYCVTGQERGGGGRYARIELSEKVCDSADRLRDTLIHEMCHAATWLINGVRDGHGNFWKLYARKSTVVHPELPVVTRCHSYDIKFKFQYKCTRCENTIGRHSKSLDTDRFVCALCTGRLVLLNPTKAPTPFANFVKENYGSVRQELVGQSHAEVMRKLSADFALKTKVSQS